MFLKSVILFLLYCLANILHLKGQSKLLVELLHLAKYKENQNFVEIAKAYAYIIPSRDTMYNGSIEYIYSKSIYEKSSENYRCKPQDNISHCIDAEMGYNISLETTSLDLYNIINEMEHLKFKQVNPYSDFYSEDYLNLKIQINFMEIVTSGCTDFTLL